MKDECSSNPTCLEVPFDTVSLTPTRDRDTLRGGLGQTEDPSRRPKRQEVVVVRVAVADELIPKMVGGVLIYLMVDSDIWLIICGCCLTERRIRWGEFLCVYF